MMWYDMISLSKKCWLLPWCAAFFDLDLQNHTLIMQLLPTTLKKSKLYCNHCENQENLLLPEVWSQSRALASVWWHKRRCTADLVLSRNQGHDVRTSTYGPPKKKLMEFCPLRELSFGTPFPFSHSQKIRHWDGAGCRSRIGVSYEMLPHCTKTNTVKNTYPPGN